MNSVAVIKGTVKNNESHLLLVEMCVGTDVSIECWKNKKALPPHKAIFPETWNY